MEAHKEVDNERSKGPFREKRRQLLVDRKIQLYMILVLTALSVLPTVISFILVKLTLDTTLLSLAQAGYVTHLDSITELFHKHMSAFTIQMGVMLIITIGTFSVAGLYLTHRIVGPIFRMTAHLKQIVDSGDLREVHFRKGDFFDSLQESFNNYVAFVNKEKSDKLDQ